VVTSGAGAAGIACLDLLVGLGLLIGKMSSFAIAGA
jgi:malic enzyme